MIEMTEKNVIARLTVSGIKEMSDAEYRRLIDWLDKTKRFLSRSRKELANDFRARLLGREEG
jgi:hypothetical protein